VARVASELPSALLSLGWTTRGEGGYYAEEDVDAMDAVVGAAAAAGLACHARRAGVVAELVFLDVPGAQACPLAARLADRVVKRAARARRGEAFARDSACRRACFDLLAAGAEVRDHDGGAARRAPSLAPAIAAAALGAAVAAVAAVAVLSLAKWRSTRM
jgi:hypothetical protein